MSILWSPGPSILWSPFKDLLGQNPYKCFEPQTNKFFISRHVVWWKSPSSQPIQSNVCLSRTHKCLPLLLNLKLRFLQCLQPRCPACPQHCCIRKVHSFRSCLQSLGPIITHLCSSLHDTLNGSAPHLHMILTLWFLEPTSYSCTRSQQSCPTHAYNDHNIYEQVFKPKDIISSYHVNKSSYLRVLVVRWVLKIWFILFSNTVS